MTRAQRETPDLEPLEIVILTLFSKVRAFSSTIPGLQVGHFRIFLSFDIVNNTP